MNDSLTQEQTDPLVLYGETFQSRLLLGTARYPSPAVMEAALRRARPAMVTASLRRQGPSTDTRNDFWELLKQLGIPVLPNTAGCHSAQEVITTAQMAREVFETHWIKLELIGDDYTLQPDTLNLPEAAAALIRSGFKVLPYTTDDLVLCQRLVDVGCQAVMPWAAPIGTGKGPINPYALRTLRERLDVAGVVVKAVDRAQRRHPPHVPRIRVDGIQRRRGRARLHALPPAGAGNQRGEPTERCPC